MFAPQPIANDENAAELTGQENLRRQQIMRFGLIICLLFLLLDNGNQVNNQAPTSPKVNSGHAEIPLADQYSLKIKSIYEQEYFSSNKNFVPAPVNSTGLYRGPWKVLSGHVNSSTEKYNVEGSVLVQLVSVPVKNLPDISFVYGLLHLYKRPEQISRPQSVMQDVGFPVQGIVVSSENRMVLFSTPYRSQRLYVRIGSKHHYHNAYGTNIISGNDESQQADNKNNFNNSIDRHRKLIDSISTPSTFLHNDGDDAVELDLGTGRHAVAVDRFSRLQFVTDESLSELQPHLLHSQQSLTQQFSAKVVRRFLQGFSGSVWPPALDHDPHSNRKEKTARSLLGARATVTGPFVVGSGEGLTQVSDREVLLTGLTDFGFVSVMLADQPLTSHKATAAPPLPPVRNKTEGEFLISIAIGETVLPGKFKALQSTSLPPSLRPSPSTSTAVAGLWGNPSLNTTSNITSVRPSLPPLNSPASRATSAQECQYLGQLRFATKHSSVAGPVSDLDISGEALGGTVLTVGDAITTTAAEGSSSVAPGTGARQKAQGNRSTSQKHLKLEPVTSLSGELSSGACGKTISFEANAFTLEFNTLKVKVELYALVASLLSLIQVFLVVYQITYCSTQAQAARISLVSLFGQSLLDANLCMAHLLLSFAFPAVFFASFIWICVLKMLLFSVLLMRFITNTYQARYAQELAAEGFSGVRRRLIGLHAGFYGVLLLVLLVSISFYERPVVAVFAMYSFWLPQVVYSAYTGTKHSFHPVYLVGVSLCHLFIPLYILGCPNNFLGLLSIYINPQYLAEVATEQHALNGLNDAHGSFQHHQPLSSASACWVLVIWMALQVGMLLLQTALGPRFFIPKKWLPAKYDYKRSIPAHLCAAFPASNTSGPSVSSSREGSGGGVRNESVGDIAMTGMRSRASATTSPPPPGGSSNNNDNNNGSRGTWASSYSGGLQALFGYGHSSSSSIFNNTRSGGTSAEHEAEGDGDGEQDLETGRLLGNSGDSANINSNNHASSSSSSSGSEDSNPGGMECAICCNIIHFHSDDNLITPCDHVFHAECLERWAHVKLECPVCRSVLPTLGDD